MRQPKTSPSPTTTSPNAVSCANRWAWVMTVLCRNSRKNPTGFPSAYLPTSVGMTWIQRSEAVGTGRKPQASVRLSLVKIAFANHTPTAIRSTASQRSGTRMAGCGWTCSSISVVSSWGISAHRHTAVAGAALGATKARAAVLMGPPPFHLSLSRLLRQGMAPTARATFRRPLP
ncbi:MAG: hypothetical protein DMD67_18230 [Gemmatimonadetes bacterium]|nr:MAG: hypothetical protein DMD67_18230 [Gemmatimonadota bacterium]